MNTESSYEWRKQLMWGLVLVIVGCSVSGYLRRPVLMGAFVVVVAAYVGAALVIGMQIGDYHVLGFGAA